MNAQSKNNWRAKEAAAAAEFEEFALPDSIYRCAKKWSWIEAGKRWKQQKQQKYNLSAGRLI